MDKRTEYVEKLSAQLVAWDVQIEQLKYQAASVLIDTKKNHSGLIRTLQLKRDEAAVKLQGISAATDDEWEDLKTGTENIWGEVRSMVNDAIVSIK